MIDLSASLIEYVPKCAMLPFTTALYSSAVPVARLLDANFGRLAPVMTRTYRPLASSESAPFAFGPNVSLFLPSISDTAEAKLYDPTTSLAPCAKLGPAHTMAPTHRTPIALIASPIL